MKIAHRVSSSLAASYFRWALAGCVRDGLVGVPLGVADEAATEAFAFSEVVGLGYLRPVLDGVGGSHELEVGAAFFAPVATKVVVATVEAV